MANKEYLHQDIETGLMEGVQGVQQGPATPGQPVEVSATGFIDASLLPSNYDPSIPVTAAENIPAGSLCYYTVIGGIAYLHLALGTSQATIATCFTKQAIGQGATGAAYIYGTAEIPNLGSYDTSEVGQSLYLSSSLPGSPSLTVSTTPNQWIQHVGAIIAVNSTEITFFFTGIFDNGHAVGTTAQGQLDPATLALLVAHLHDTTNPHATTCAQIGAVPTSSLGQPGGPVVSDINGNLPEALQTTSLWSRKAIRVVATSNITIASPGATIDGVAMNVNDRVLLVGQTVPVQNGVYLWTAYNQPMTRATDAAAGSGLWAAIYAVIDGTSAGEVWMNTNSALPVVDSSALTYKLLAGMPLNFMTNPIQITGDLLVGDPQGNPGRLPVGPNASVLTMIGGVPAWAQPVAQVPAYGHVNDGQILGVQNGGLAWVAPPSGGTTLPGYGNAQNGEILGVVNANLAWVSAFVNPMLAPGDMLIAQAGGQPQRLAIGSTGQVLTVIAGTPTWVNAPNPLPAWNATNNGQVLTIIAGTPTWTANAGGVTNPMTGPGDMVYGAVGGIPTRLPSASGVLVNNGTTPSWVQYVAVAAINADSSGLFLSNNGSTTQWVSLPTGLPAMSSVTTGMILANNGTVASWVQAPQGFTNPMTTAGDLLGANVGGSPARISIGAAGTVLTSVNGAPTWQTPASPFPAVAGNGGAFLRTDGSAVTWAMLSQVPGISGAAGMFLGATSTGYAWLALPNQIPSTSGQSGKFLQAGASGGMSWVPIIALPDPTNHSGQVLTTDGVSVFWVAQAAQTTLGTTPLSYTTSSINPGSGATFAVNTTCLIAQIIKIAASAPCRVRVYGTAAEAAADYSRPVSQDPGTVNVGIYAEFVFTGAVLALVCSPIPTCCNLDATPATTLYLTVENTGTTAAAITITATLLKME